MMTPTERSMPAVRMTRVWPTPTMPMTITWVSMVEKLLAAVNREGLTMTPKQHAEQEHDEGHDSRIGVQEALGRWRKVRRSSSKEATVAVALARTFSNSCGAGRPVRFAHRFLVRFRSPLVLWMPPRAGTASAIRFLFQGIKAQNARRNQPQQIFMASSEVIEGTPATGMIRHQLLASVYAHRLLARS